MIESLIQSVHNLIMQNLPMRTNRTPSGWHSFDCVMCDDQRKRAGVKQDGAKISYHCFNCGYTTGWVLSPHLGKKYKDLAAQLGAEQNSIHQAQIDLLKHRELLQDAEVPELIHAHGQFHSVQLPQNACALDQLPSQHELVQYATRRGIMHLYPLLHFDDVAHKRRVIVPFMFGGQLVGWSGRHVAPPDKNTPKYLQNTQPGYVFNVDAFANSDRTTMIVSEGIFDAILLDGVSVLGNEISTEQAQMINRLQKQVILCPDRDAAGKQLIEQALDLGWAVSFPPWQSDCKDAADAVLRYGRLATVHSVIAHATHNKTKIRVQSKML